MTYTDFENFAANKLNTPMCEQIADHCDLIYRLHQCEQNPDAMTHENAARYHEVSINLRAILKMQSKG